MNKTKIKILILLILNQLVGEISGKTSESAFCDMPSQCKYCYRDFSVKDKINDEIFILCDNIFDSKMLAALTRLLTNCTIFYQSEYVSIFVKESPKFKIVNEYFNAFKLNRPSSQNTNSLSIYYLQFLNVKGFDIESTIYLNNGFDRLGFTSEFNLYKKNQLVTSCNHLSNSSGFIFKKRNDIFITSLKIFKTRKNYPVCTLFFRNARIKYFRIDEMVNSYYYNNMITFSDPLALTLQKDLDCIIKRFELYQCFGLDINHKLLNTEVFKNTEDLRIDNSIVNSIQTDLFKSLQRVNLFSIDCESFIKVIKKQGIDWIMNINKNINVDDLSNTQNFYKYKNQIFKIRLIANLNYLLNSKIHYAYNKDFCLFSHFPFRQLVFVGTIYEKGKSFYRNKTFLSCTELWLFQFYTKLRELNIRILDDFEYKMIKKSNFTACQFERRINLCNKLNYQYKNSKSRNNSLLKFSYFEFLITSETLLIFLSPFLALFGFIKNILVIYVIFHKTNKKAMRKKHYIYMSLHCALNIIICFTQIIEIMHECQYYGIYCSSVRMTPALQYFKIIDDYINCVCRLLANFAYFGFSLCRMSQIGKDHGKFIVFIDKLSIKKFFIFSMLISGGLSVCKVLRFNINIDQPRLQAPLPFVQNYMLYGWQFNPKYVTITVFNTIYDTFNYLVFVLVHCIIDIVLFKKLKSTIDEKEIKMKELIKSSKELEKSTKESQESKRRVLFMIIYNSVFNLITKVPSMITSFNDLRLVILKPLSNSNDYNLEFYNFNPFNTKMTFKFFCSMQMSCLIFQKFGNCLFLFSIGQVFSFLKRFDKNFKEAYKQAFPNKLKVENNQTLNQVTIINRNQS